MLEDTDGTQGENSDGDGDGDGAGDGDGDGGNTNPNTSENQNSAGEDGGKSDAGGDGSGDGQQGDGGGGDNKEGESQDQAPTGESLLDLFRRDPQAQALVREQAQAWANSQQTAAAAQKAQTEIDGLIDDGDYEELGKRFAKDTVTNRAGKVQADAALQEAFGGVYRELFALPELQNLTAEEKSKIDASKFTNDADYIPALLQLIVSKRAAGTLDKTVEDMLTEKLKVLENMAGAGNSAGGSPNVPGGTNPGGNLEGKSARELLTTGWSDILTKAGYPSEDN